MRPGLGLSRWCVIGPGNPRLLTPLASDSPKTDPKTSTHSTMIREREKERCLASVVRAQRQWPADIAANILRSCTFPRMPYIYIGSAWLVPMWMRRIPPDPPCKPVNDMALPDSRSHNLDANCQGSNSQHFVRQVRCLLFPNNANTIHLFITLGAGSGRRELSGPKRQFSKPIPTWWSYMALAFPRVSEVPEG